MSVLAILTVILHAFHISVTDIQVNEDSGRAELVMSIFADDLENAINLEKGENSIDILNTESYQNQKKLVSEYVFRHTKLRFNNRKINLIYLGHEIVENRCMIYLESIERVEEGSFSFENNNLLNVFKDQKNIVHFKGKRLQRSILIDEYNERLNIDLR